MWSPPGRGRAANRQYLGVAASLALLVTPACSRTAPHADTRVPPAHTTVAGDSAGASRTQAVAIAAAALRALGASDTVRAPRAFELTVEARARRGNWAQARQWTDSQPFPIP